MANQVIKIHVPDDVIQWIKDNAINYEVMPERFLIKYIRNEIRRNNEIALKGHTDCYCGRNIDG
jgi:hypothetical protein